MKFRIISVTPFKQNCTLLWCEKTRHGAVVDPGGDLPEILAAIAQEGVIVDKLLLTHGHIDHAGGAAALALKLGVPIEGPHSEDAFLLNELPRQSEQYGFPFAAAVAPNRWLKDGDTVQFGEEALSVLHTPGHTPGHVVYFHPASKLALVGDVLFRRSVGRTDFPRGDYKALVCSIREHLFPLGDDIEFISGHGEMSSFGEERRKNPFVGDNAS
jgi:hydroxyacylglutathione hydrolase